MLLALEFNLIIISSGLLYSACIYLMYLYIVFNFASLFQMYN